MGEATVIPGIVVMGTVSLAAGGGDTDKLAAGNGDVRGIIGSIVVGVREADGHLISNLAAVSVAVGEVDRVIRTPNGEIQIQSRRITGRHVGDDHADLYAAVVVTVFFEAAAPFWLLLDGAVGVMPVPENFGAAAEEVTILAQTIFTVAMLS
jgi:hypothetical protein